jgi:hypothetical protein
MYVLVEHYIHDPKAFWSSVRYGLTTPPTIIRLHHCLPTEDGTHAACVWEAERLEDVSGYMEAYVGHLARSTYHVVEATAGINLPSGVPLPDAPGAA